MKNKNIKPPNEITRYITWMGVSRLFGSQDRPRTWDVPVAEISFTLKLHGKCPPWYSRWVARSWSGAMHSSHRRCSWQQGQAIGPRANLESHGSCLWKIYMEMFGSGRWAVEGTLSQSVDWHQVSGPSRQFFLWTHISQLNTSILVQT